MLRIIDLHGRSHRLYRVSRDCLPGRGGLPPRYLPTSVVKAYHDHHDRQRAAWLVRFAQLRLHGWGVLPNLAAWGVLPNVGCMVGAFCPTLAAWLGRFAQLRLNSWGVLSNFGRMVGAFCPTLAAWLGRFAQLRLPGWVVLPNSGCHHARVGLFAHHRARVGCLTQPWLLCSGCMVGAFCPTLAAWLGRFAQLWLPSCKGGSFCPSSCKVGVFHPTLTALFS